MKSQKTLQLSYTTERNKSLSQKSEVWYNEHTGFCAHRRNPGAEIRRIPETEEAMMLTFQNIIGQQSIKTHFENAISTGKVSHAYILSGEEGMGKMTLAEAFALSLLCENRDQAPCLVCHSCKQVLSHNHPDLIYVTHEKPASIGVDDIRYQLNDTVGIKPYSSKYKIYIVDEAEKMTQQAQNALLKTIEEPPAYAVIILLTSNQEMFLPTILSRCIQLKLKPLKDREVKDFLIKEKKIPEDKAEVYGAFARGNLGKAIHLAESEEFQIVYQTMLALLKHLRGMDIAELMETIRKLKDDHLNLDECLDFMQLWYRDVLMFKVTKDINLLIFKEEYASINDMSKNSSYQGLEAILEAIDKARVRLKANVNMELVMELMLLVMKEN